jgi:serine phosphatase RsbU (regulator of sigma subunit)
MAMVLSEAAAKGLAVSPPGEPRVVDSLDAPEAQATAVTLLERLTDGFAALDLHGRMTFLTERTAQLLHRDRAELQDAEPWEALPWLSDPVYENAFVAALFSREPTAFSACRPDGVWLSFALYPDATGITLRIAPGDAPRNSAELVAELVEEPAPIPPARAGTLFHLLHLAAALAEATGVEEVAKSLMGQMRAALGAQGLALLISRGGREWVVGSRGFPPEMAEYFNNQPMAVRSEGTRAMSTGVPGFHPTNEYLVRTFPEHPHYRDMAAFAFLPLTISGGTFGCLVLGSDRPHPFTPDERAELTSLAGMIAQALERARLYDANARVARGLQDGLLPRHLPRIPRLRAEARYRPATNALDVGGDFYDLIDFGEQGAGAVIGDVQGHSVQAAALMGQIRTAVHSHARAGASPEEILARTNRLLLELNSDLFCSCLYAHIDMARNRVLLASAGHPPPILRDNKYRADVLDLPPGLLLGVDADARFETVEVPMVPGSLLALYTDGLIERPGIDLGRSIEALAEHLARAGDERLDLLADSLVEEAQRKAVPQNSDDIALLLLGCDERVDMPGRSTTR